MEIEHYKSVVENLSVGYAYHKILCDDLGTPYDYEFKEVNAAFERLTGWERASLIGRKIRDLIPEIGGYDFQWIKLYGDIAFNGENIEFQQYLEHLDKWFRINVYAPEKGYFVTFVTDITKEMHELEERAILLTSAQDIIFELDEEYIFTNIITNDDTLLFMPRQGIIGKKISEILPQEFLQNFYDAFQRATVSGQKEHIEYKSYFNEKWYRASIILKKTGNSKSKYVVSIIEITEQKKIEYELAYKTEELERFFYINLDLLCIADLEGNFIKVNKAWEDILGYPKEELERRKFLEFVHPEDMDKTLDTISKLKLNQQILYFVNRYKCKDDSYRYIEWCSQPYGQLIYAAARDITAHKEAIEQIQYLSYRDQLTGLYNRRFYEEELSRFDTPRNLPLSIILADVNSLKLINDTFGHMSGDELLKNTAKIMKKVCREEDVICRIGGDEFAIILPNMDYADAGSLASRILKAAEGERVKMVDLSIAIGWDTKTKKEENIIEIFTRAEEHMYHKKASECTEIGRKNIDKIIMGLYAKSPEEKHHAERVSKTSIEIGRKLELKEGQLDILKKAGLLHDIGKVTISESILHKSEALDSSDWIELRRHPETGYRILNSSFETVELAKYVLSHHELWNGLGYPKGLKGEEIPIESRIIAIAEAYHRMRSEYSYRKAMSKEEAIDEIRINAGTQFDPYITQVFLETFL